MKFLTTKEATHFGVPQRIQVSGFLLILGAILVYWGLSLFFIFGSMGRTGAILVGSTLIGIATLMRTGPRLSHYFIFLLGSITYFALLLMLTRIQGHAEWIFARNVTYSILAFSLFICGYILGSERPAFNNTTSHWLFIPVVLALIGTQLIYARSMQTYITIARARATRSDFGGAEVDPISLAFTAGCLATICLGLALVNKTLMKRILYFAGFFLLILIMLSSASRGATVWMAVTLVITVLLIRRHRYFNLKHKMAILVAVIVAIPALILLYHFNTALAQRIDILWDRMGAMFTLFDDSAYNQQDVSNGRNRLWMHYLGDPAAWLVLGEKQYSGYPHNLWLEAVVRYGLLGLPLLIIFIYTFAKLMIDAIRARIPADGEFIIMALLFTFAYLSNLTSLSITVNRALFLGTGYFLGYYLVAKKRRHRPPVSEAPAHAMPNAHLLPNARRMPPPLNQPKA